MGTGIIAAIKGFAPLLFYLLGIFLILTALAGRVRWAFLFLTFLLTLRNVVEKLHSFPLGTKYITLLALAILVGWVVSAALTNAKPVAKSPLNIPILILIFYTFFSMQYGNIYLGLNSILDISDPRVQDWKNFTLLPLIYFLTLNNIKEKKCVLRVFAVMCASMLFMDYYTSGQVSWFSSLTSRAKITGTFQFLGPNEVAAFYNQYTMVLLGVFVFIKRGRLKTLVGILILLNIYCMVFMYSRAAYLGFTIGLFLIFLVRKPHWLIPLFLVIVFWRIALPEQVIERIVETTNQYGQLDASSERRLAIWSTCIDLFGKSPIIGIGYGVFRRLGYDLGDTHNIYLKIMVEQGLVGLFFFLVLLFVFFSEGIRLFRRSTDEHDKGLGLGFAVSIVVLAINNIFGDRWSYLELSSYLWISAGLITRLNLLNEEPLAAEVPQEINDVPKIPRTGKNKKTYRKIIHGKKVY